MNLYEKINSSTEVFIIAELSANHNGSRDTAMQIIAQAKLAGAVVAMDRQEKAPGEERSAIQALEAEFGLPIIPVITFSQVIDYVANQPEFARHLAAIEDYRSRYGVV